MAEEAMTEPQPLVRAFDQPWHIRGHERSIAGQADDAEVWRERGERVVGDLRLRRRNARNDRRLAGVGEADDANVGEELELQPEIFFFTGQARLRASRRAVGRR